MLLELEFGDLGFWGGRKTLVARQELTTHDNATLCGTGPESNPGHIGERRALSSLLQRL